MAAKRVTSRSLSQQDGSQTRLYSAATCLVFSSRYEGFGLPCLNHACDANTATISDLFSTSAPSGLFSTSPENESVNAGAQAAPMDKVAGY